MPAVLALVMMGLQGCPTPGNTPPSSDKAITDFQFASLSAVGAIAANAITVHVPYLTSVSGLVATFTTGGATVKVGSLVQTSGATANDFTNPVVYLVTAADGSTAQYTVTVVPASGFVLTTTVSPASTGSVARSLSQATYLTGASVSLTATPASGYTFSHWSGGASGSGNPMPVTMNADKSVTAVFLLTSSVLVTVSSGGSQTGVAGTQLAGPLTVKVADTSNNPLQGVTVSWAVGSGGGSVGSSTSITGSGGLASTAAKLGAAGGGNTYTATVSGAAGSPVTFTASAAKSIAAISGNNQQGGSGTQLASALVVKVTDNASSPVSGITVSWAAATGGGSVGSPSSVSDSNGLASVSATLGAGGGSNTYTATVSGLTGSPVTFSATAAKKIAVSSGNSQAAVAGATLASPLVVQVTDNGANPVSGISVSWAVASGGGSVGSSSSVTDVNGLASTSATLGAAGGSNTYTAAVTGLTGSPVTFSAAGATIVSLSSGNGQAGAAGSALASPLTVAVTDNSLNPVSGITVSWAATTGGGGVSSLTSVTDASGLATTIAILGTGGGANTYTATVSGLKGSPVSFTATAATNISLSSGGGQRATVGTALPKPLVVFVADPLGGPVQGVTVTWAAPAGGGTVASATSVTDVNGLAQTTATPGTVGASANTFTATVTGLTGSPVAFTEGGL